MSKQSSQAVKEFKDKVMPKRGVYTPRREKGYYIYLGFAAGSREEFLRFPFSAYHKLEANHSLRGLLRAKLFAYSLEGMSGVDLVGDIDVKVLKHLQAKGLSTLDLINIEVTK